MPSDHLTVHQIPQVDGEVRLFQKPSMPFGTLHSLLLAEHDQQKEELLGNRVRMKSIDKPSYEPDRKPDPNDNPIKRNGKTIKL